MLRTLAALALLGLAASAPAPVERDINNQVIDGQVVSASCGPENSADIDIGHLKAQIPRFCWHDENSSSGEFASPSPRVSIGQGYFLHIQDSQGGSHKPCERALNWVADNCARNGKTGQYTTNANIYSFERSDGV